MTLTGTDALIISSIIAIVLAILYIMIKIGFLDCLAMLVVAIIESIFD
ncbi:hypothetical protein EVB32_159 [Rhizobium phage RHph_TM39]|uniref:Uncharacterized protein n=2 Tax=Cuauhnahuacvirus TaxID=3044696 RepID=A0A7S5R7U8_9CAUD|nr:hypothetical protein PQC16_gp159 [Rhizobium phage RHph_TM30]YP_010671307.1 hypothetical protein PQC17_gp158 [Rhizobium phage RHph_Y65]QIG71628.1 hypothetical protein EVB94_157 [Rhizobium phage RHph_TM40]QIG71992.1 hypothetical protein EVB95_158 [Rhizobium phage RHph_TM2_3B]QIG72355.1 hypothetical protein EVB96_159 [Rhizobium phage RHph_TM3_3_6]QIG77147.1 hypothetical protein EVB32_159 [Rhizobium phage RHph_TM39]QIG77480.1 hypothetical protein EVB61_152 [Rhizobium phage RHph_TM21B]QIG77743